jgi:hypothetical protein
MTDDTKISSGRCHGPGCTQTADGDFCGEDCSVAWQAQFWRPGRPLEAHPELSGLVPPSLAGVLLADEPSRRFTHIDLAPFQQAIDTAVRQLAEAAQMSPNVLNPDPDGPTSAGWLRSHDPVRVDWRDPVAPSSRLRLGELANLPAGLLAYGVPFAPGARTAAEVDRLNTRLRAAFPDRADEAIAAARHRAHTSLDTYAQAVDAVIVGPEFASANADEPQVAPSPDPTRGWLRRLLDRWKGQP